MDKLKTLCIMKKEMEDQIITSHYQKFIKKNNIVHKDLCLDLICTKFTYKKIKIDCFGLVGNEYEVCVVLTSPTGNKSIMINLENSDAGSGSANITEIKIDDKTIYFRGEYFGNAAEYYEDSDIENDEKMINMIKKDKDMMSFVTHFLPSLKKVIDEIKKC